MFCLAPQESWLLLSVTKPAMSGLIAGREFIDLITLDRLSLSRVIASGKSVEYSEVPKKSELVRGYNHPCGTLWEVISGYGIHFFYSSVCLLVFLINKRCEVWARICALLVTFWVKLNGI